MLCCSARACSAAMCVILTLGTVPASADDTLVIPTISSANLILDFRASNTNATTDGQSVTSWTNTGTLGSAANATVPGAAVAPVLRTNRIAGQPTVQFNTSTTAIRTPLMTTIGAPASTTSLPTTIFAVTRLNGNDSLNNTYLFSTAGGEPDRHDLLFTNNSLRPYNGSGSITSGALVPTRDEFAIWRVEFDTGATGDKAFINTTQFVAGTSGDDPFNGLTIGNRYSLTTGIPDAEIAELLVYDDILASEDLDLIGGFLAYRFGITGTGFAQFTPPQLTPEPGSVVLFSLAAAAMSGGWFWRRRT